MKVSLFTRLFLAYFFLLILAASMSVYAIMQLGSVTGVTRSIILSDNPLLGLHKDLTDALLSETRYEKKYLIVQDAALYTGFLKSKSEFEHYLREAMILNMSREAQGLLNDVADLHLTYVSLFQEEAKYLKKGFPHDKKAWYAQEKDRAVNAAIDDLLRLRALSQQTVFDKVKQLDEAGTRARTIAMGVSAAMIVFGMILAIWMARSITHPLEVMQKKTRDIADGVFEADLKLPSLPEIGELAQALNTMCSKLKEVDRMKSDFFALMSHELRTPLTTIREGTNLFLEGKGGEVTEKQIRLLTIISEESDRLIGLVNSVLDLSKLESGMLAFNITKSDLAPLITRVVNEAAPLAEAKHIKINREIPALPALPLDTERMLQALRNLLGNALKFTPRGGTICIAAWSEVNTVIVTVTDSGPGIPKEHAAVIFDKFRQVPGSAKHPGTGLGLAIVKHIIQAHGGSVWVQSDAGCGSTFTLQLPA